MAKNLDDVAEIMRKCIVEHYEVSLDPYCVLPYHRASHTFKDVLSRFKCLVEAVRAEAYGFLPDDEVEGATAGVYGHDADQTFEMVEVNGLLMRKRFSGLIEPASAMFLARSMRKVGGFNHKQIDIAVEGVMATVPAWDGQRMRLTQPNLKPGVRLTSVLLALADIGAGVISGAPFANEGRMVFTEDHLYVLKAFLAVDYDIDRVRTEDLTSFSTAIINYLGGQVSFLQGQADRVEEEILPLVPKETVEPIRQVCTGTAAARKSTEDLYAWAKQMRDNEDYANLFRIMGYPV